MNDHRSKDEQIRLLQRRIKNQRAELRRLNQQMTYFWHGWSHHGHIRRELEYRGKMVRTFGSDAVCAAERKP